MRGRPFAIANNPVAWPRTEHPPNVLAEDREDHMDTHRLAPRPLRWCLLLLLLGLLVGPLSAGPAYAADIPPRPEGGNVFDETFTLTPDEVTRLNEVIAEEDAMDPHVHASVLVVFGTQDESLEDYSRQAAAAWKQGGADDGVLIVASMGERELRIQAAEGAQDLLDDSAAEHIMNETLEPAFKEGSYAIGLEKAVRAVYREATPARAAERENSSRGEVVLWVGFVLLLLGGVALAIAVSWRAESKRRAKVERELDELRRTDPGIPVDERLRMSYQLYRGKNTKPPRKRHKPVLVKDANGVERQVLYAPDYRSWLPLYTAHPEIYGGRFSARPEDGYSGSALSSSPSSGGGGGGGGASGSF